MVTRALQQRMVFMIMAFVLLVIILLLAGVNLIPSLTHSLQIESYLKAIVPDGGVMPPPHAEEEFPPSPPPLPRISGTPKYDILILTFSLEGELLNTDGEESAFSDEVRDMMIAYIGNMEEDFGAHSGYWYLRRSVNDGYRIALLSDAGYFQARRNYILISSLLGLLTWFFVLLIVLRSVKKLTSPLEEAFRRQKQFTADAGHELRTPLASIKANAEVLRARYPESKEVDYILSEADRMSTLTEELTYLAVLEDPLWKRGRKSVDISRVIEAEALALESLIYESGMRLEYDLPQGIVISCDSAEISRLSSILLSNAIKYGREGGVIRITGRVEKHRALILFYNTGSGVSSDELPHIFDRFYRSDSVRSASNRNYGLGLSIAAAIVSAYGGSISAESEEGEWMKFTIAFPLP